MLRFVPKYHPVPWGGRRFEDDFGRDLPAGPIGESWELVCLPDYESVVRQGSHEGRKLSELWQTGALGGTAQGEFPFLLKWLDTSQWLSVQVHPDQKACDALGAGQPKNEAWLIVHNEPDAAILLGHYPGLEEATLRQAAAGGTVQKWLYESRPRAGEMLLVEAGTLHAIGPGYLLLEVQQPSDTTYRVYDWKRMGLDGKPRELHLDEACKSIKFDKYGARKSTKDKVTAARFEMTALSQGQKLAADRLRVLVADSAGAKLRLAKEEVILEFGDVVVLEPSDGEAELVLGTSVWITEAP